MKRFILLLLIIATSNTINAQNLLVNGDFEAVETTGFDLNNAEYKALTDLTSVTVTTSSTASTLNADVLNSINLISGADHTTGNGKMLVVNGNTTAKNQIFYRAGINGNGVCGLTIGKTYTFSYWIKSLPINNVNKITAADIKVQFKNAKVISAPLSSIVPLPEAGWQLLSYSIIPTLECVNIEIANNTTTLVGADFAMDDFSLRPLSTALQITTSSNNQLCATGNTGSIVAYAINGVPPYVSYSLTGTATVINTTGVFTGLPSGTYAVTITDSSGNTATQSNIVLVAPTELTVSPNTSICSGNSTTLTASGSTTGYIWSATPTDATLITPSISNPTVSPTVTTTYTVKPASSENLIFNGNFSLGNSGFNTNYQFLATTTPAGAQKTYGISTNAQLWFPAFSSCTDHTGGGNMMVVDGSTQNLGTDKVWAQTISVVPGQTYTFKYWLQTVAMPNPAIIDVVINGTVIGTATAATTACGWTEYSYTWPSGTATLADISLINRNVNGTGNDFAIDDLSFTTSSTCPSKTVIVSVNRFTLTAGSANYTACINNAMPNIAYSTLSLLPPTTFTGLPPGITGFVLGNNIIITGTPTVAGVYNYTISSSSSCGTISTTGTITVPTNNNSVTSIVANPASVCPGYSAVVTVTATPNTYVTLTPSNGAAVVLVNIGAGGTGSFTTPGLNADVVYYINTIVGNPAGCIKNITGQLAINVNQGGCASSGIGQTGNIGTNAIDPICNIGDCRTLTANISNITPNATPINDTTAYTVSAIPYCPQAPFENPTWTQLHPGNITGDDSWGRTAFSFPGATSNTPAFKFCFYGTEYSSALVGTNGVVTFNTALAGQTCPWSFSQTIPNTAFPIKNAILGVYQDTDYSVTPTAPAVLSTNYNMYGTYPCRKFVVNFTNLPQFSCNNNVGLQTSQIVIYEISNIIEVYVKRRVPCNSWQSGAGVIGIINSTGAAAVAPTGRNTGNWTAIEEAYRFTPDGPRVPVTFQWYRATVPQTSAEIAANNPPASAVAIGTANNTTVTVCPTVNTDYYGQATYTICGNQKKVIRKNTIEIFPDNTSAPIDLYNCANTTFDLTVNTARVTVGFETDYDVFYYTNALDQANGTNALTNAQARAYQSLISGQTIYLSVVHNATYPACTYNKQFKLYWNRISNPTPNQCIDQGGTPAPMAVASGIANVTFVYYTTPQAGASMYSGGTVLQTVTTDASGVATYTSGALGTANALPNIPGKYYVYAIASPPPTDPTCRPYQEIIVDVCGSITAPSATQTFCLNTVTPSDPSPISISTTYVASNSISFVYYSALQTGSNMYNGGTLLGTATPVAGVATFDIPPAGSFGSIPNSPGTYYVYAITNQAASCASCKPFELIKIVINPLPSTPTITVSHPSCLAVTGSLNVTSPLTNSSDTYNYNINGGLFAANTNFTGLAPGNHVVCVKNVTTNCEACANVTVNPIPFVNTITRSSALNTDNQTLCRSTTIIDITYVTTGAAGATVSGLPSGVVGVWANNVFTISGTPVVTGSFPYTVTTTGGCGIATATGTLTVNPDNTITLTSANANQTVCINTAIANITHSTVSATGATVLGLPAGLVGTWSSNVFTISGVPTASGSFPYTITTTGGCNPAGATASGTIIVTPADTIILTSANAIQTVCINTPIATITHSTVGSAGATVSGLPTGLVGAWSNNIFTISGTPSVSGSFPYTITTTGGCGTATATGTINVTPNNTIVLTSANAIQRVCINTPIVDITYTTTTATGATVTGLPAGLAGVWSGNVFTISGAPTASGIFPYTITTTGGCNPSGATATGVITVNPNNTASIASSNPSLCVNTLMTNITHTTTGATGIGTPINLPNGVTAAWLGNVITITGTPTNSGVFNYTIPLAGGCGLIDAIGTITVVLSNTITLASAVNTDNQTACSNAGITNITYATIGAAGATVSGLPSGVVGSWASNVFTISGTPVVTGSFPYTVTTTGGCGIATATGTLTVNPDNTITLTSANANQTVCINTAIANITHSTVSATGATVLGLPAGLVGTWSSNVFTISGVPTASGSFPYTITTTGGCNPAGATASGTIIVTPADTIILTSANAIQTVCINTPIATITHSTVGSAGATVSGLPTGLVGAWSNNIFTISGTPSVSGSFPYTITTTGGCGTATATGTINVTPNNTIVLTSANAIQRVCINTPIVDITYTTTTATGATVTGLPAGLAGVWSGNVFTISGAPTASGIFPYTITTTGGCNPSGATATGVITVTPANTITLTSAPGTPAQTVCINTPITNIRYSTTIATGVNFSGLPAGVSGNWVAGVATISGTPTNATGSPFTYTITTIGGCGVASISGTISVTPSMTNTLTSPATTQTQGLCLGTAIVPIEFITTGATGAIFAGLPPGVLAVYNAGIITITGTPTVFGAFPYTITPTGGCSSAIQQGVITIINAPTIFVPTPLVVCDNDILSNDGYSTFDLHTKDNQITGGQPFTVRYYETLTDAQNCYLGNEILGLYQNNISNPNLQTVYFCVTNPLATACNSVGSLQLIVKPLPIIAVPTAITDYQLCDYNPNPTALPVELFDLHTKDIEVGVTAGVTAYYYAVDPALNPSALPISYLYTNTSNGQTIWVRLVDNTTTCKSGIGKFKLIVNPLPAIAVPIPSFSVCETSTPGDGFESFDLLSRVTSIVNGQAGMVLTFHESLAAAQLVGGPALSSPYTNTVYGVQTIFVKLTNVLTGCYKISTMTLRVNQLPDPVAPLVPIQVCDTDQDNYAAVNLNTLSLNIASGMTITYYSTFNAAETGLLAPLTSPYTAGPLTDILYARVVDPATGCYKVIAINLEVTPAPLAPVTNMFADLYKCDDSDNNNNDGITNFNLNINGNILLSSQPLAASNYTVTYHFSLPDAQNGNQPIVNSGSYINTLSPNTQIIWISIKNNATGCRNWGSFKIIVDKPLVLTAKPVYRACDDDNSVPPRRAFDLTSQNALILSGAPLPLSQYTVTYYTDATYATPISAANALAYINAPVAPSTNAQTLGVMVTTVGGCKSYSTLTIEVLQNPNPRNLILPVHAIATCDNNASPDGVEVLNIAVNQNYIANGNPNLTFEYYASMANLVAGTPRYLTPTAQSVGTGIVYIKVLNTQTDWQGKKCYAVIEQPVTVNPLPLISKVNPLGATTPIDLTNTYQLCQDPASTLPVGVQIFNLTTQNTALLAGNPAGSTFTVSYFTNATLTTAVANPVAFQNTTNPQTIYFKIVNNQTACINKGSYELRVAPQPIIAFNIRDQSLCDKDGTNDGMLLYPQNAATAGSAPSLAGYITDILGTTQTTGFTVSFYLTQAAAITGLPANALTNLSTYQVKTGTYWVRVENDLTHCYILDSFDVVIEKLAEPIISSVDGSDTICVSGVSPFAVLRTVTLDSGLLLNPISTTPASQIAANYTFEWYLAPSLTPIAGQTGSRLTVNAEGVYTVKAISKSPAFLNCGSAVSLPFTVKKSGPAVLGTPKYFVSNAFGDSQTITVNQIAGNGIYEYSLDGGAWQTSLIFSNVPLATTQHTIDIRDVRYLPYSCAPDVIEGIYTVDYPHFFTPNGDGVNDLWSISGLGNQNTTIYIYDRAGRLLKQISSCNGCGWDGTFVGQQLPADDYWFTIEFVETTGIRTFKSHFTLKR